MSKSKTRANVTVLQRLLTFVKWDEIVSIFRFGDVSGFVDWGSDLEMYRACVAASGECYSGLCAGDDYTVHG